MPYLNKQTCKNNVLKFFSAVWKILKLEIKSFNNYMEED